MEKIKGIVMYGGGIGDKLQFAAVPENYYRTFGKKLADIQKHWFFDYNPYVERDVPVDETIDLGHGMARVEKMIDDGEILSTGGYVTKNNHILNSKCFLTHPRLYRFEDSFIKLKTLVVHLQGRTVGTMPEYVIDIIKKKYEGWQIYQVGSLGQKDFGFTNLLGTSLWDVAKLLSSTERFIGVDSSVAHIANCYPAVEKRIVVSTLNKERLITFKAGHWVAGGDWFIPHNLSVYNAFEENVGESFSYLNI